MLKNFWYACEFSDAVKNQPKAITLLGQRIILYRNSSGQVIALKDQCCHRGAALSLGKVEGDCIRCPYHGWKFQADGSCVEIPANKPGTPIPKKANIDSYPVQEKYGFIWIFWGDISPENSPPLPSLSDFPDDSWGAIYMEIKYDAHYTRVIENLVDFSHLAFVHKNSFGSSLAKEPHLVEMDKILLEEWGGSRTITAKKPLKKNGLYWRYVSSTLNSEQQKVEAKAKFYMPNFVLLKLNKNFSKYFFSVVPENENTTVVKYIWFRNFLTHPFLDGLLKKVSLRTYQEDKIVLESQFPLSVPDLQEELHTAYDGLSVAYRKVHKKCLDMGWGIEKSL